MKSEYLVDIVKGVETLTIEDLQYLPGYFVFALGTNAVVQFKIKECPGWLFGIWWKEPTLTNKKLKAYQMKGQFFAQYEEIIDKFKPSYSQIKAEILASRTKKSKDLEESKWHLVWTDEVLENIKFIIKEPALAFCRDWCGWNYNIQFHDRRSAKRKFEEWKQWNENRKVQTKICNDKMISFTKEKLLPLWGNNAKIRDEGDNCSPQYQPICLLDDVKDFIDEPGYYDIFKEENPDLEKEFDALEAECKEISHQHHFYWHNPISYCCLVLDIDHYNESKEEII